MTIAVNTYNTTKKTGFDTANNGTSGSGYSASDYLRDNSIFSIAAKSRSNETASEKDKSLMAQGKDSKAKATDSKTSATGWISKCTNLTNGMITANKNVNTTANQMKQQGLKTEQTLNIFATQAGKITSENDSINSELADLTSQRESLMSGNETGVGKKSAFSLSIDSGNAPQKAKGGILANDNGKESGSGDSSEITSLDSKIASLSGRSTSNTEMMAGLVKSASNTSNSYKATTMSAHARINADNKASAQAAAQAAQAATVAAVTTGVGIATSAVGVALAAGIFTAPAAPPVAGAGAAGTATGVAATAGATATATTATTTATTISKVMTALPKIEKAISVAQSAFTLYSNIKQGTSKG